MSAMKRASDILELEYSPRAVPEPSIQTPTKEFLVFKPNIYLTFCTVYCESER